VQDAGKRASGRDVRGKLVFLVLCRRDGAGADADAGAGRGNVGGWVVLIGWMVQDWGRAGEGGDWLYAGERQETLDAEERMRKAEFGVVQEGMIREIGQQVAVERLGELSGDVVLSFPGLTLDGRMLKSTVSGEQNVISWAECRYPSGRGVCGNYHWLTAVKIHIDGPFFQPWLSSKPVYRWN
jgi:hypothetical protein